MDRPDVYHATRLDGILIDNMGILGWLFRGSRIGRLGGRFVLKYERLSTFDPLVQVKHAWVFVAACCLTPTD